MKNEQRALCVFDLDGTMDLTDKKLSSTIIKLTECGINLVVATGRTNSYVKEVCRKYNIVPPRYIIADNGGSIYDTFKKEYIKKTDLPQGTRKIILEEYLKLGGSLEEVRATDGDKVYVAEEADVKKYYEKEESIVYMKKDELLETMVGEDSNLTKMTLAGSKALMKRIMQFIKDSNMQCSSDIGATKFPIKSRENYRLDITDGETSKGEAIRFLMNCIGISKFVCIGNGFNDLSMFKFALDSGMPVIIVANYEEGELTEESRKLVEAVEEYAKSIQMQDNVTGINFPANKYLDVVQLQNFPKQRRKNFIEGLKCEKVPKIDSRKKGKSNLNRRIYYRGEK